LSGKSNTIIKYGLKMAMKCEKGRKAYLNAAVNAVRCPEILRSGPQLG
jgi:hypothetical protein